MATATMLRYGAQTIKLVWPRTQDASVPTEMLVLKPGGTNQYISKTTSFFGSRFSRQVDVKVSDVQVLMVSLNDVAANLVAKISNTISARYYPESNNGITAEPVVIAGSRYGVLTTAMHSNTNSPSLIHNFGSVKVEGLSQRLTETLTQYDYKTTAINGHLELQMSQSLDTPTKVCRPYNKRANINDLMPARTVVVHCTWRDSRDQPWDVPVDLFYTINGTVTADNTAVTLEQKVAMIPFGLRYAYRAHGQDRLTPNFIFILPPWSEPITFHKDCFLRVVTTIKRRNMTIVITVPQSNNVARNTTVDQEINAFVSNDSEALAILASQPQPEQSYAERGTGFVGTDQEYDQTIKETLTLVLRDAGVTDDKINVIVSDQTMDIWRSAYTHSQYVETHGGDSLTESYERMEFFGDAVVDMLLKSWLMENQRLSENPMTEIAHKYLSKNTMPQFTRKLGLQKLIRTQDGKITTAMEEDVYESTMGALFSAVRRVSGAIGPAIDICQRVFMLIMKPLQEDIARGEISKWARIPYFTALDQRLNRLGWRVKKFQSVVVRPHVIEGQQLLGMFAANQTLAEKFIQSGIISSVQEPLAFHKSVNSTDIKETLSKLVLDKLDKVGYTDEASHLTSLEIFVTRYQGGRPDLVNSITNRIGEFNNILKPPKMFVTVKVRTVKNTKTADCETSELRLEDLDPVETSHRTVLICTHQVADKDKAKYMMLEYFVDMPLTIELPKILNITGSV